MNGQRKGWTDGQREGWTKGGMDSDGQICNERGM
jgi:hypothetical protein